MISCSHPPLVRPSGTHKHWFAGRWGRRPGRILQRVCRAGPARQQEKSWWRDSSSWFRLIVFEGTRLIVFEVFVAQQIVQLWLTTRTPQTWKVVLWWYHTYSYTYLLELQVGPNNFQARDPPYHSTSLTCVSTRQIKPRSQQNVQLSLPTRSKHEN
jgi:hypothetical protein